MTDASDQNDNTRTHVTLAKAIMVSHYRIVSKIGAGGMGATLFPLHRKPFDIFAEGNKINKRRGRDSTTATLANFKSYCKIALTA